MARGNGADADTPTLTSRTKKKQAGAAPRFETQSAGGHWSVGRIFDTLLGKELLTTSKEPQKVAEMLNQQTTNGLGYVRVNLPARNGWRETAIYCLTCGQYTKVTADGRKLKAAVYKDARCAHMPSTLNRYSVHEQGLFDQQLLAELGRRYLRAQARNSTDPDRFEVEPVADSLGVSLARVVGRLEALERQGLISEGGWRDLRFGNAVRRLTKDGVDAALAATPTVSAA